MAGHCLFLVHFRQQDERLGMDDNAYYDALDERGKHVVDLVCDMFGDLFDNNEFGPFIGEFTHYSKDRVAELMEPAIGNLLLLLKVTGLRWRSDTFPYGNKTAEAALQLSLTCEVIRHLIRSYVEIPDTGRVGAPDIVRRDYLNRWQSILQDYDNRLKDAAKKLTAELYDESAAAGLYTKVLVDYPSMAGSYIPFNTAERPSYGFWW